MSSERKAVKFLSQLLDPPHPSLEIMEQPVRFHRYRYESEVTQGRLAGLLLGRGSSGSCRSFIRVRISGIDHRHQRKLWLFVSTVTTEGGWHPYYLMGDGCRDGYFCWEREVSERTPESLELTLDRLTVICVRKSPKVIAESLKRKRETAPQMIHFSTDTDSDFHGRNLDEIRLAFQLAYQASPDGPLNVLGTVLSDVISSAKNGGVIALEEVNPIVVSPTGGTDVAVYVRDSLAGFSPADIELKLTFASSQKEEPPAEIRVQRVKELKKHLIVFTSPDVYQFLFRRQDSSERLKARLSLRVGGGFRSSELTIFFDRRLGNRAVHQQPCRSSNTRIDDAKPRILLS